MAGQILVIIKDPILKRELFNMQSTIASNFIFANEISDRKQLSSFKQIDLLISEYSYFRELNDKERAEFFELNCPTIVITGSASHIAAFRVEKPDFYPGMDQLTDNLSAMIKKLVTPANDASSFEKNDPKKFITRDPKLGKILEDALRVANFNTNLLILGESGTGKDVLAHIIHQHSLRKHQSFVKINCAAIPQNLLETELFGAKPGAFTGAVSEKIGKIKLADGGTLFLDEIGDLHPELQGKLLRVLESGEIDVVGGTQPVKVDVRLISATNKDLSQLIRQNKFREDLYYRLNVIALNLPPLRERPEDIVALFDFFAEKFAKTYNIIIGKVHRNYLADLFNYHWPGNVREFKSFMDQLVRRCQGQIFNPQMISRELKRHVKQEILAADTLEQHLASQEKLYILKLLSKNNFQIIKTADELGIDRVSLYRKLKKYNIDVKKLKKNN